MNKYLTILTHVYKCKHASWCILVCEVNLFSTGAAGLIKTIAALFLIPRVIIAKIKRVKMIAPYKLCLLLS